MTLDDILSVLTLAAIVIAILLARRGARKKVAAAYAKGEAAASARASAGVVVGDVIYQRGHGSSGTTNDNGASDHYDRAIHYGAAHTERDAMYRPDHGHGLGDVRDVGVSATGGQLPSGSRLDHPSADGGRAGAFRPARQRLKVTTIPASCREVEK